MGKTSRIVGFAVKALLIFVMTVLVVYNAWMLAAKYILRQDRPTFFGYSFAVVTSGSMEPELEINGLMVTNACDTYSVGDVITFFDSDRNEYVTHRIILTADGTYTTKGDANNWQDLFAVPREAVVGKVVASVGGVGGAVLFLQSPAGFFAVLGGGALIWLAADLPSLVKKKERKDEKTN